MLFDPDAAKSIEDIILEAWEYKITPQRRAEILAIAEESGRTWFEVIWPTQSEQLSLMWRSVDFQQSHHGASIQKRSHGGPSPCRQRP